MRKQVYTAIAPLLCGLGMACRSGADTNAEERERLRELMAQRDSPQLQESINKVIQKLQAQLEATAEFKARKQFQETIDAERKKDQAKCQKEGKVFDEDPTHVLSYLHCVSAPAADKKK